MQMRMDGESLAPGVEDREEADLGSQMPRIGGDALQGFGRRPEQQSVHLLFVLQGQRRECRGESEDDVKTLARQQLSATLLEPLGTRQGLTFWAVPIGARIVCVAFVPALVTALEMSAQGGGAAGFDGAQNTFLRRGQRGSVRLAKLLAVGTHDVRDFECRPHREPGGLRLRIEDGIREQIQRAGRGADGSGRQPDRTVVDRLR